MSENKILSFKNLNVQFHVRGKILDTIRNIDFDVYDGELVAIVGESGSGKSVLTKAITSILDSNGYVKSGQIIYYPRKEKKSEPVLIKNGEISFETPIDFIDIHDAITPQGTKNFFINIINKKINKLKKINKEINSLDEGYINKKILELSNIIDDLTKKRDSFTYNDVLNIKLEKKRQQLKKMIFFKKILLNEEFKNENIKKIDEKISLLKKETEHYAKITNEKKSLLKRCAEIYLKYLSTNEIEIDEIKFINERFSLHDDLFDFENEIIEINNDLLNNKKIDNEKLQIIINRNILLNNSKAKNKRLGKKIVGKLRGSIVAVIPQDPMTSLNPLLSVGFQISEALIKHTSCSKAQAKKETIKLLEEVGIDNPEKRYKDIPGEYSGGMRQRVVIAIALACRPKILICDEPTTALDVTIQATILKLIKTLQKKYSFTTIFITHDLGVVANIADRVAVMYAGQIIEYGTTNEIFNESSHPYTWALLSSLPQLSKKGEDLYTIVGAPPSLNTKIVGDAFAPRNDFALEIDYVVEPPLFKISETHYAKTWLLDKRAPKIKMPKKISDLKNKIE